MEFYKMRRKAIELIKKLYDEGETTDTIYANIGSIYGFGRKFVDEQLSYLRTKDGGRE